MYNGISHVVMIATTKDLAVFAIGFSLSEGIIAFPDDIYDIWQQLVCNGIEVHVELLSSRRLMQLKVRRAAWLAVPAMASVAWSSYKILPGQSSCLPFTQCFALAMLDRGV